MSISEHLGEMANEDARCAASAAAVVDRLATLWCGLDTMSQGVTGEYTHLAQRVHVAMELVCGVECCLRGVSADEVDNRVDAAMARADTEHPPA